MGLKRFYLSAQSAQQIVVVVIFIVFFFRLRKTVRIVSSRKKKNNSILQPNKKSAVVYIFIWQTENVYMYKKRRTNLPSEQNLEHLKNINMLENCTVY